MSTAAPGWYAEPDNPAMLRWFDGVQWTEHRQPAMVGGPFPPARPSRSPAATVLLVVGCVVAAVVAVGVLAAIAIPVFLNERHKAAVDDLRSLSCAEVGAEAVTFSRQNVKPDEIPLAAADAMVLVTDARAALRLPQTGEVLVMRCSGTATWADQTTTALQVDLYTNSAGDHLYALDWRE
ncbi:DUF2510 domain-containing protein [Cellulomonas edaphi]|uniref:DUF2510 domain-containing protein n=1 Tax=Cellulomonas edaphi TaxID=3053468 RepID=A0ABT7S468_9CELL|nr:DUF2510 domain-containing protein [Cellulomons edaphi]MDM7829807.1 DUF2510 domain-containing protein [Cellulomons edaphi]